MKRNLLYYHRLKRRYFKYHRKLQRASVSPYHHKRVDLLVKRLKELYWKLVRIRAVLRTAAIGGSIVASVALFPTTSVAQELSFMSPNSVGLAHAENFGVPTFTDLDGDGDQDIVVGERFGTTNGGLFVFTNENGRFKFNTETALAGISLQIDSVHNIPDAGGGGGYFGPDFADYDNDGDEDLFIGQTNGDGGNVQYTRIRFFENDNGSFTEKFGAENPLSAFGDGNFTKPAFADLDSDGDLDAIIGKDNGEIVYWENDGSGNFAAAATNPFSGFFSGENSPERSDPAFADLDGDGDLDVLVGHKDGTLSYLENTGSATVPVFNEVTDENNPFAGLDFGSDSQPSPEFQDLDADGDNDLFVGTLSGPVIYVENVEGEFVIRESNGLGLVDVGNNSKPQLIDWDEDGDMDAAITSNSRLRFFENEQGIFTELSAEDNPFDAVNDLIERLTDADPEFVDWDGDGYQDLFVGSQDTIIFYLRNDQMGEFENLTDSSPFGDYPGENSDGLEFLDFDDDGDLDAFVGTKGGNILYFENRDGDLIQIEGADNPFDGISFGENAKPDFYDWDRDGDLDAFIGKFDGEIRYFLNNGDGSLTEMVDENPFAGEKFVANAVPEFGDINGDGVQDAIVGDRTGKLWFYQISGTAQPPEVSDPIDDQTVFADSTFSLQVDLSTFSDPNNDIVLYRASQSDGNPLPAWLSYDREARTFSGTPSIANLGSSEIMVTAVDADNNSVAATFSLTVEEVITALNKSSTVEVYPNPASRSLFIETVSTHTKRIELLDLKGSLLRQVVSNDQRVELRVEDLEKGIYLIKISQGNESVTRKIIVH